MLLKDKSPTFATTQLMHFIYPGFLFGLFAIGIPILIHLFNFRRFKKILFTNVKFLKEVKNNSQKKRSLKHYLVLCARILSIISLVMAFAQPFIADENKTAIQGQKAISIYIDNSFSMNAISDKGPLLETAKAKALEIASSFASSDKFQLLTNVFNGANDRFCSKEEFIQKLDDVAVDPSLKTLSEIIQKQSNALINSGYKVKRSFIISDFQKSFVETKTLNPPEGIAINFIPLKSTTPNNLSIDSAWFISPVFQPGKILQLMVRITNHGNMALEGGTLNLKINGLQKSIAGFDISTGATKVLELAFSVNQPGWQDAELNIIDHPIVFDDRYNFTFQINPSSKILALHQTLVNGFIKKLFDTEPFFILDNTSIHQVDYSKFDEYDLILLTGASEISSGLSLELNQYILNGGQLAIFPDEKNGLSGMDNLMTDLGCGAFGTLTTTPIEVGSLDFQNELFKGILKNNQQNLDLPKVKKYYILHSNHSLAALPLIKMRNGDVFLKVFEKQKGKIYQFAVNLDEDWSNFQHNQIFVPLIFQMAFNKHSRLPLENTIGKTSYLMPIAKIKNNKKPNILKNGAFEIMTEKIVVQNEIFLTENNQVKNAGLYKLLETDTKQPLQTFAFNYNRNESNLSVYDPSEIKNLFSSKSIKIFEKSDIPLNTLLKQDEYGKPLWRLFIWLALLFIAIEILLLRFWKNTTPTPSQAPF